MNNINRYVVKHLLVFQGLGISSWYILLWNFLCCTICVQFTPHFWIEPTLFSTWIPWTVHLSRRTQIEKIICYVLFGFYSLFSKTNGVSNYMREIFFFCNLQVLSKFKRRPSNPSKNLQEQPYNQSFRFLVLGSLLCLRLLLLLSLMINLFSSLIGMNQCSNINSRL